MNTMMKRTILLGGLLLVTLAIVTPAPSRAAGLTYSPDYVKIGHSGRYFAFPVDAIGLTEKDFNTFQYPACEATGCFTLKEQLAGKVIFRAETNGAMYRVNQGDVSPVITRYLPDGFYVAGKKYYWMTNGSKVEIKKGKAFQTILNAVRHNPEERFVTPVSEKDFELLKLAEEGHGFAEEDRARVEEGSRLFRRLAGSIVMRVEDKGQLVYVRPLRNELPAAIEFTGTLIPIEQKVYTSQSLYQFIRSEALRMPQAVMDEIPLRIVN